MAIAQWLLKQDQRVIKLISIHHDLVDCRFENLLFHSMAKDFEIKGTCHDLTTFVVLLSVCETYSFNFTPQFLFDSRLFLPQDYFYHLVVGDTEIDDTCRDFDTYLFFFG